MRTKWDLHQHTQYILPLILAWMLPLWGCNLTGSLDKPAGDAQILSAARACFDAGDFNCATTYYGQLSTTSSDTVLGEEAFAILSQNGLEMTTLISAAITYGASGGKFLTKLAAVLSSGSGQTKRLALFHAYQLNSQISNPSMKGLVRFLTSAALLAEILGENATTTGTLLASDLVQGPTTCLAATAESIAIAYALSTSSTLCAAPATSSYKLVAGTNFTLSSATDANFTGSPSIAMLKVVLTEVSESLSTLGAASGFGGSSLTFSTTILNQPGANPTIAPGDRILIWALISNNIGAAL